MQNFEKLKLNRDFRRLYGRGKSFVAPGFVLYTAKGRKCAVRLGITVSKKLGGAVARNRAKRLITAAFRACSPNIISGNDFVIVARSRIFNQKSTEIAVLMKKQLIAAGLWCDYESDKPITDSAD